jgi:toxin ParE1/3/4
LYSQPARADIASIHQYSAKNWGIQQAEIYTKSMRHQIGHLTAFPELGRAIDSSDTPTRVLNFRSYVIYYRITVSTIDIIRIVHQRTDQSDLRTD